MDIIILSEIFRKLPLDFIILFPSTIIKLEIAFTKVSTLLTVKEIANNIIIIDNIPCCSFNNKEKNARSGTTFGFLDTAINPLKPIINIIGIIIIKEIIKLFLSTL